MTAIATKNKLSCFCSRRPLLAMYGIDEKKRPYVHVKVWKQRRVFAEFVAYGGEVAISCRECFRWHSIVFKLAGSKAELKEVQAPAEVEYQEELNDSASIGGSGTAGSGGHAKEFDVRPPQRVRDRAQVLQEGQR